MIAIDQHSAIESLYRALVPGKTLVDGRSERDRLCFLASFGSLINFYDQNNQVNGNWSPFLLKDPVFLLAHISTTPFTEMHYRYVQSSQSLSKVLDVLQNNASTNPDNDLTEEAQVYANGLFDQLIYVFSIIERWTFDMQRSFDYDLKKYVLAEVTNTFSAVFWAILSLRETVSQSPLQNIYPVASDRFASYDEIVWKQSKGKQTYWELLGMTAAIAQTGVSETEALAYCYTALNNASAPLFRFLHTIVRHAETEFEKVKTKRSRYPDTTLLRVFGKLMEVHQAEQNQLSERHLHFYYNDILRQVARKAIADTAYLCAVPAKPDATSQIPAGTVFDGGADSEGNPLTYVSLAPADINPATIGTVYTVAKTTSTSNPSLYTLLIQSVPDTGVIKKDAAGNVQAWNTFGGTADTATVPLQTGIAFASPLLLLREGQRVVTLDLEFENAVTLDMLNAAQCFLSTAAAWLPLNAAAITINYTPDAVQPQPAAVINNKVTLVITLTPADPAIEAFPANAEKLVSAWPMLKMQFNDFSDPSNPPVITSCGISVSVSGVKNFMLYNDFGALSTKGPFPPFGPTPLQNSNFIIGSNELFSKPLNSVCFEMIWDVLPANFQTYYQAYNNYLQVQTDAALAIEKEKEEAEKEKEAGFWAKVWKGILKVLTPVIKIVTMVVKAVVAVFKWAFNIKPKPKDPPDIPYNNVCFTVDFSMLQSQLWQSAGMNKLSPVIVNNNITSFIPYTADSGCNPAAGANNTKLLFSTMSTAVAVPPATAPATCVTTNSSYFGCTATGTGTGSSICFPSPDPAIQLNPLAFTDTSASGFMRMTLTGPVTGFGSGIYQNVVTDIALRNGISIFQKKDASALLQPASLPFVPKLVSFAAQYTASHKYVFASADKSYPGECFVFSPLYNGIAYTTDAAEGAGTTCTAVPLFPAFPYSGALFIQLVNAVTPADISIYFQLARSYANITAGAAADYFYLQNAFWQKLPVLSDGTNGFNCSGIINASLPGTGTVSTDATCWLMIGVTGSLQSFSQTVFLQTNGFAVQQSGTAFLNSPAAPFVPAGTIAKTVAPLPQIAAITQPFPSFGGAPAEDHTRMNQRVSTRIKTKDRIVSAEDCYRIINENFGDIFYSKTIYNSTTRSTGIYVVRQVNSVTDANAFLPLITRCREFEINSFIASRSSAFAAMEVSNFLLEPLQVVTTIIISDGYEFDGVSRDLNNALNLFLSPWIIAGTRQIKIDSGISNAEVSSFINTIEGVASVVNVSFNTGSQVITTVAGTTAVTGAITPPLTLQPAGGATALFVPAAQHIIKYNTGT